MYIFFSWASIKKHWIVVKSGAWSIVLKKRKSQYFWNPWKEKRQATEVELMGQVWDRSAERRDEHQQEVQISTQYFTFISLCMETALSVKSKTRFLLKIFVLLLDSAFFVAMITPTNVCSFVLGAPFQQDPAAHPAAVDVVELVRARWHTGYVGESPPRTSFHIQQGLGWMKWSLCKQLSVSLKKQSNRCFQWRQHQCFAF